MAVVLVDVETLLGEELKDSFRHAVNILMVIIYFSIKMFFLMLWSI
jgi:hypothetical protein